jgi:glycosyltransferase involved in cell wall biosynthesis
MTRLLILSNSHPAVSKGGSELAAWRMFEEFAALPGWETWLLGCGREPVGRRLGSAITQPFSNSEFLYSAGGFDWFKFANIDEGFPRDFEAVLREVQPDILHFHHYMNFGVEAFLIAKRVLPNCRIVLTLHEFQAICNHQGQMVTRPDKSLCEAASPRACNRCYPDISRADFFLRQTYIQRFFDLVDQFVAPSHFLANRFVEWGVPAAKMAVIENVIAAPSAEAAPAAPEPGLLRVGFFGQITPLKGIAVLLAAAAILERDGVDSVSFDIHGDYSNQQAAFQEEFRDQLARAGANVRFHGPYDNSRVDGLMRGCDLIAVPSIWWENSPVVIQEALRNRRPIVCSDIGGMAEKVRPDRDGFHFRVGNALALATLLRNLAAEPGRLAALQGSMRLPPSAADVVAAHVALYEGKVGKKGRSAFLKKSAQKTISLVDPHRVPTLAQDP